jgi:hypothetical protein
MFYHKRQVWQRRCSMLGDILCMPGLASLHAVPASTPYLPVYSRCERLPDTIHFTDRSWLANAGVAKDHVEECATETDIRTG